jgi:hypothetical protein
METPFSNLFIDYFTKLSVAPNDTKSLSSKEFGRKLPGPNKGIISKFVWNDIRKPPKILAIIFGVPSEI